MKTTSAKRSKSKEITKKSASQKGYGPLSNTSKLPSLEGTTMSPTMELQWKNVEL